jgi:CBS domain containing-hemolysin-like protein
MDQLLNELAQNWGALTSLLAFDTARLSEPEMIVRLSVQVVLLLMSAFFSGSETALFSLSRFDLQQIRKKRNRHSETLHALLDQPRRLIISILSGNELVNIAATANMTFILVSLYGDGRGGWINLFVMVPLLLLFGEVTPKTIAVFNPVRFSTRIAKPMDTWVTLVTPLRLVIRGVADRVTTLIVGAATDAENILRKDEFLTLVEEVAREGELSATERALIHNLLEAGDTEIVEIMTPRTRVKFLNAEMKVPEIIREFQLYQHPRAPVFREHRDNLVGFVHAEDVLRMVLDQTDLETVSLEDLMHPPVVVPLTKKVDEMFDYFSANSARAAACLNEFGGVEGFITMKDVINFIFGEISGKVVGDELYQEQDENTYIVPGDMKLNYFDDLTNFGLEDPRMTTIGGVAFRHLDRLPREGDKVTVDGFNLTILEMDAHRIAKVQVSPAIGHSDDEEEEYQPEVTGADSSGEAELPDEPEQEMEPADTPNGDVQEVPEEAAGETMLDADEEPSGAAGEETSQDEESATVEEQPQESGETTDEGAEPGDDEAKQQKKTAG